MGYVHDTHMSQFIPPTLAWGDTATWAMAAGQVAHTKALHGDATDETATLHVPVPSQQFGRSQGSPAQEHRARLRNSDGSLRRHGCNHLQTHTRSRRRRGRGRQRPIQLRRRPRHCRRAHRRRPTQDDPHAGRRPPGSTTMKSTGSRSHSTRPRPRPSTSSAPSPTSRCARRRARTQLIPASTIPAPRQGQPERRYRT